MSRNIRASPEVQEAGLGEAIACRTAEIKSYHGLGPPDLCVIEKSLAGWIASTAEGYYHWVLGLEPYSAKRVSEYVTVLAEHQEPVGWFDQKYVIENGVVCLWNAISRVDVRVEVDVTNDEVIHYAVDADEQRLDMSEVLWEEVFICSVLRIMGPFPIVPALKVLNPALCFESEAKMLGLATKHYERIVEGFGASQGVPSPWNNVFLDTVKEYFLDSCRYKDLIEFITPLSHTQVEIVSVLVEVLIAKKEWRMAGEVLVDAMRRHPDAIPVCLLASHGLFLKDHGLSDGTFTLNWRSPFSEQTQETAEEISTRRGAVCLAQAQRAIVLNQNPKPWLLLAEIYCRQGFFAQALVTLNSIPLQGLCPILSGSRDRASVILFPSRIVDGLPPLRDGTQMTKPSGLLQGSSYDADVPDGDWLLDLELAGDEDLRNLQGLYLGGNALRVYHVLIRITYEIGWDALLDLRSKWFEMLETNASEPTAPSEGRHTVARWFDTLFHLLHADLKEFQKWKIQTHTQGAKPLDPLGIVLTAEDVRGELYDESGLSYIDWWHRGKLAERLMQDRMALQAYRMSCFIKINTRSCLRLLSMYSTHGFLTETTQILTHTLDSMYVLGREGGAYRGSSERKGCMSRSKDLLMPGLQASIRCSLFKLVSRYGLQAVRKACADFPKSMSSLLEEVWDDAIHQRVDGHER